MDKKYREDARELFELCGQFEAVLHYEDDRLFAMDWKDKKENRYIEDISYIVDKEKGTLIINGHGGCIANFRERVSVDDIARIIDNPEKFIWHMTTTSNDYTYNRKNIEEDVETEKKNYLRLAQDSGLDITFKEQLNADFTKIKKTLVEMSPRNLENGDCLWEIKDILNKYYITHWWEEKDLFLHPGRRVDNTVYLWIYGYQEGVERLRGKELVRKDI